MPEENIDIIEEAEQLKGARKVDVAQDMHIPRPSLICEVFSSLLSGVQHIPLAFVAPHATDSILSFVASLLWPLGNSQVCFIICFTGMVLFFSFFYGCVNSEMSAQIEFELNSVE